MNLVSPFSKKENKNPTSYFDNSNRVARTLYRVKSYSEIFTSAVKKGIPVSGLIRSVFPFALKDAEEPPIVAVEMTNYCNLKCPYCTNSLGQRKRGFMSDAVFDKLINNLSVLKPNRVQLVGNGESTLHPKFDENLSRLAKTGKYISMVTNGQWEKMEVVEQMLKSLDLVEISIDAGGKEKYEASRINGSYDALISNLELLNKTKKRMNVKTKINIRVMTRPSEKENFQKEFEIWNKYADRVMPQYVTKINNTNYEDDVFIPVQSKHGEFPKCSMPFKHMEVKYTGEVLMCYYTLYQLGVPGLVIGNILNSSIKELWNCKIMKDYREAHRKRLEENMPACKGCPGT